MSWMDVLFQNVRRQKIKPHSRFTGWIVTKTTLLCKQQNSNFRLLIDSMRRIGQFTTPTDRPTACWYRKLISNGCVFPCWGVVERLGPMQQTVKFRFFRVAALLLALRCGAAAAAAAIADESAVCYNDWESQGKGYQRKRRRQRRWLNGHECDHLFTCFPAFFYGKCVGEPHHHWLLGKTFWCLLFSSLCFEGNGRF